MTSGSRRTSGPVVGRRMGDKVKEAPVRVALIGDGGISRSLRTALSMRIGLRHVVSAILVRPGGGSGRPASAPEAVTDLGALLASDPDIVVECAGHSAVRDYAATVLLAGKPMVIVSAGALAEVGVGERLEAAAVAGRSRLILASGAMAGIDALSAAKFGGLDHVRYRGRKHPLAWRGTPAEESLDLDSVKEPTIFYRGNARDAALLFPRNSNVAATIAMAGIGFERTEVELVADPLAKRNIHELMFDGGDGRAEIMIDGAPSKANPKTSVLTAHSIARLLQGMYSPFQI